MIAACLEISCRLLIALSVLLRPDPSIVIDAECDEEGKKNLKTLKFPLMDDDGLPSSYANKVLTCLAQWRVKVRSLETFLLELDTSPDSVKQFLGND